MTPSDIGASSRSRRSFVLLFWRELFRITAGKSSPGPTESTASIGCYSTPRNVRCVLRRRTVCPSALTTLVHYLTLIAPRNQTKSPQYARLEPKNNVISDNDGASTAMTDYRDLLHALKQANGPQGSVHVLQRGNTLVCGSCSPCQTTCCPGEPRIARWWYVLSKSLATTFLWISDVRVNACGENEGAFFRARLATEEGFFRALEALMMTES